MYSGQRSLGCVSDLLVTFRDPDVSQSGLGKLLFIVVMTKLLTDGREETLRGKFAEVEQEPFAFGPITELR